MKINILSLILIFLLSTSHVFSQNGVMDNFDDNTLDPNWKFDLSCASCYTGTESNSELKVVTTAVGGAYENFEFQFPAVDITANPVVKINVKNAGTAFNLRIDLEDASGIVTNATPNVKAVAVNASYVQYTFDFTGLFNQTTPAAAAVDPAQISKVVFFVNPGGAAYTNTIYFDNLIIGNPAAPTAGFTASAATICTGAAVTFTNTSSNRITSYAWNFGTGATPATATTYGPHNVTWSSAGTKTITLTVTGPGGTNTSTGSVTVNAFPSAAGLITGSVNVCSGNSANYSIGAVSGATGYTWNLPGGANVTAGNNTNSVTISFGSTGGPVSVTPYNATCGNGTTSPDFTVLVAPSVTADVTISTPNNNICSGSPATFTATPTNGGSTPTYQWKVNGLNVGTGTNTFTSSTLANNDQVTVAMTSNASCATNPTVTSNAITMNVTTNSTPSVSISTLTPTICSGDNITIAAHPVNGGTAPAFVWKKNGNVITDEVNDTLIAAIVIDQDVFTCEMTANGCISGSPTVTSNSITVTVNARNLADVFIATFSDTVCIGSSVDFTATPVNGGSSPSYQWMVNGTNAGSNSPNFTAIGLNHKDEVSVEMTSNATLTCLTNNPASAFIEMNVVSSMTSAVHISASATSTCSGSPVTFTATPVRNAGTSPSYQWKVDGANAGTGSTFTTSFSSDAVVTCEMTSGISCAQLSTSNAIQITITTSLVPAVTISTPSTTICSGSPATFTATPANGGPSPSYQWFINGVDQSAVNPTFTAPSLVNGDKVSCVMTSSLTCASTPTGTSNEITMTVNPIVVPSLTISASSTNICSETPVTFTATPVNEGTNPSYAWKVNGNPTGMTGSTFISSDLQDTDVITCEMISDHPCASTTSPVVSNSISMTVQSLVTASVSISASSTPICPGTAVTFTAAPVNEGSTPVYEWKINTTISGSNSATFSPATLSEGDQITCTMTSNATCVTGSPATSNILTVTPSTVASINITASENPVCSGRSIDFTSTVSGAGTSPGYQWKKDNVVLSGETNPTYSASGITDGETITCELTSNATCVAVSPVTSNSITVTVTPSPTLGVTITTPSSTICAGETATFTASPSNGGTSPSYQWQVGGQNVGTDSDTYSTSTLSNGNIVTCIMTSSQACAGLPVTSNSITMTVNNPSSDAAAGWDQYVTTTDATLDASPPASGTGVWTTAGSATIITPSSVSSAVQNLSLGANVFTWTVTNGSCTSTSDDVTIYFGNPPSPQVISGPVNVAAGSTGVTYSINANSGSTYIWTVVGATSYTVGTNTVTVDFGSGDVYVSVTELNNYGDYTADLDVSVGNAPSPKTITGEVNVVAGSTGISYSVPFTSNSTYSWTVTGATFTGQGTSSILVDFGSSDVTISLTESNNYGSYTAGLNVSVGIPPATPVIIGPDSVVANTNSVTYSITAHSTTTNYIWQITNGTIASGDGTNTITVDFGTSDATIIVTEENPWGFTTTTKNVAVGTVAQVSQINGPANAETGTTTYTYTAVTNDNTHSNFYWTFPAGTQVVSGGGTSTSITVIFPPGTQSGSVTVVQDNGFGTSTLSTNVTLSPSTGLWSAANNTLSYSLFPNPFSEAVSITFTTPVTSPITLTITNMKGEVVYYSNQYRTNEKIVLGEELTSGLYAVKAVSDQGTQVIKVNKE